MSIEGMTREEMLDLVQRDVQAAVNFATRNGITVTAEQKPLQPLAMGHYETVVSVREARK